MQNEACTLWILFYACSCFLKKEITKKYNKIAFEGTFFKKVLLKLFIQYHITKSYSHVAWFKILFFD